MIRWLYHYVFRGIGIVIVIGMITILLMAVMAQRHAAHRESARVKTHRQLAARSQSK